MICKKADVDMTKRAGELSEDEVKIVIKFVENVNLN